MTFRIVRGIGETCITLGLVLLLFVAYELWGTGVQTARDQSAAAATLEELWADDPVLGDPGEQEATVAPSEAFEPPAATPGATTAPTAKPTVEKVAIGDGFGVIRIPRFGRDYNWVLHEGVTRKVLKSGPGHYPKTAMPGEVGNFVISGHRTTFGAPFNRVEELVPGDAIVIETANTWFTYRVRSHEIVAPTQIDVTAPVPRKPGATPTERLMTLTTCHPKLSAKQRYIVYAVLEGRHSKRNGALPPALVAA